MSEIILGECSLRASHPNGDCCQNLVFNTVFGVQGGCIIQLADSFDSF